jgi:DNA-binding NtrC family response regulator
MWMKTINSKIHPILYLWFRQIKNTPTMYELYHLVMNAEADEKHGLMFTVTLVDDDPLFLEQMKDFLLSMKITQIESFLSGEEFLAALKENDKRLIVCDFDFGSPQRMNGFAVLDEIRKRELKMPVIMLSAQDKITVAMETLMRGAADYFFKASENAFTSVFTSILKLNEVERLKKTERDYINTLVIGSVAAVTIIGLLLYNLYK